MGELLRCQSGMSHGKCTSMHIFTLSFFHGNGIVGASNWGQVFRAYNMVCF